MATAQPRQLNMPRWSDPCLCGSGMKFKGCCRDHLPDHAMGQRWQELARAKQWLKVLDAIRADVTQYSIYHRTNTKPLMARFPPEALEILTIDIEALHETVEQLANAYWQLGKLADFPAALERLRSNIEDPRWHRKITYHQAMTAHLLDDDDGALRELAKLGPIDLKESDVDLLQLHLDLNGEAMPLVEKLKLYDHILDLTTSRADRMHYAAAKGVELMVAGDTVGALSVLEPAIATARDSEAKKPFGPDAELWMCKLLEVAAVAKVHRPFFVEAARRLSALLTLTDYWTHLGRGHLYRCLGDVLRADARWSEGEAAYANGFELDGQAIQRVFQATCMFMAGRGPDALALLKSLSFINFDRAEQADYAIAYAAVAVGLRDLAELQQAEACLRATRPIRQYFENQKLTYLLAIERARTAIAAGKPVPKSSRFLDWVTSISRWFIVQPNIAGIGVNVNAIVDDAVAAKRRRESEKNRPKPEAD